MSTFCSRTRRVAIALAISLPVLFPHRMFAQSEAGSSASQQANAGTNLPAASHPVGVVQHGVETSVSVGGFAQLAATRINDSSSNFVTESLSPSAGVFATFQQSFKPWLGYSANFGYTRATYRYSAAPAMYESITATNDIPNNVYETSVSYIARKHFTSRFSLFGEVGGGTLGFAAITRSLSSTRGGYLTVERSNTFRPVGIAGFGVDYRLGHGLGLRGEYRGLFLRYPDYGSGRPGLNTLTSEPTLSVTYTFGKHARH